MLLSWFIVGKFIHIMNKFYLREKLNVLEAAVLRDNIFWYLFIFIDFLALLECCSPRSYFRISVKYSKMYTRFNLFKVRYSIYITVLFLISIFYFLLYSKTKNENMSINHSRIFRTRENKNMNTMISRPTHFRLSRD